MIFRSLRAKRGNLQLLLVSHQENATVACGDLEMTMESPMLTVHVQMGRLLRQMWTSAGHMSKLLPGPMLQVKKLN